MIMPLSAGARLGPYEILASIGKGGMGEVYRARDTRLNRDVAVKVLPQAFSTESQRERFQREARAASALSHPNICAVYDVGEAPDHPFLVMELLIGMTLREHIGEKLFATTVRQSIAYAESSELAISILDHRPDLGADYLALATELLTRLKMPEPRARLQELGASTGKG
jgi:eukaryotic-like serine/threonine-protein kinase